VADELSNDFLFSSASQSVLRTLSASYDNCAGQQYYRFYLTFEQCQHNDIFQTSRGSRPFNIPFDAGQQSVDCYN
jgi:hypothetical protein